LIGVACTDWNSITRKIRAQILEKMSIWEMFSCFDPS
jgi:hypothetical protein